MIKTLFSFEGSLDRINFLKYTILVMIAGAVLYWLAGILGGFGFVAWAAEVAVVWMWLALFVKRGNKLGLAWIWSAILAVLFNVITWIIFLIMDK